MKMKLIILFFSILPIIGVSQNWSIIHLNSQFNYGKNDSNIYNSTTIKIDSFEIDINGDSVFYLNRNIDYDQQTNIVNGFDFKEYSVLLSPHFLQKKITLKGDSIYVLNDTTNIIIKPHSRIGEKWLFDTKNLITAEVLYVKEQKIFGYTDSIKIILLSSNDSVLLSKSFGIIKFPFGYFKNEYFYLLGINNRKVGSIIPDKDAIYFFNNGNWFNVQSSYGHYGGASPWGCTTQLIIKILNTNFENEDKVIYNVKGKSIEICSNYYTRDTTTTFFNTWLHTKDKKLSLFQNDCHCKSLTYVPQVFCNQKIFTKRFTVKSYLLSMDSTLLKCHESFNGPSPISEFSYMLGKSKSQYVFGVDYNNYELIGFIKNGVSCNFTIDTSEIITSSESLIFENSESKNISNWVIGKSAFFPELSDGILSVRNPENRQFNLEIYNLLGEKIYYSETNHNTFFKTTFSISKPGIYFLKIIEKNNIISTYKFIKI